MRMYLLLAGCFLLCFRTAVLADGFESDDGSRRLEKYVSECLPVSQNYSVLIRKSQDSENGLVSSCARQARSWRSGQILRSDERSFDEGLGLYVYRSSLRNEEGNLVALDIKPVRYVQKHIRDERSGFIFTQLAHLVPFDVPIAGKNAERGFHDSALEFALSEGKHAFRFLREERSNAGQYVVYAIVNPGYTIKKITFSKTVPWLPVRSEGHKVPIEADPINMKLSAAEVLENFDSMRVVHDYSIAWSHVTSSSRKSEKSIRFLESSNDEHVWAPVMIVDNLTRKDRLPTTYEFCEWDFNVESSDDYFATESFTPQKINEQCDYQGWEDAFDALAKLEIVVD